MKLNFIKDREINLEKDDLLGTKPYVNTLLGIINETDTPFTIGLFGGWGTGKSSIIRTIKDNYNSDNNSNVKVFVYDAWKYSKDPFRRTLLLNFLKYFNLDTKEVRDLLYSQKSTNTSWGVSKMVSYNKSKTTSTGKIIEPEKFEGIFEESIAQIIGNESFSWKNFKDFIGYEKKTSKIVIVIDNIDRCHKDLAFELLLTVKNFLEQKNVVFVIPIDETELKKHIKKEGHDGNEFLRKLFNTTLTIKKFSEDDLFNFTKALQKKYKLELSDDVLSLISQEFSKSPRKIIQFLNVLQTEIKLAEEQEKNNSNFKRGVITENVEFLVKILLIREEWTNVYEKIKDNPFLLEDINEQIDGGDEKVVYTKDNEDKDIYLISEQRRFFESTRDIFTTNIEAFFSNRDSFPGVPDDVPKLVLSQDWKTVKIKYIEKEILNLNELLEFVDNLFNKEVVKKKSLKRSGFNIFSFIFKISEDDKYGKELLESFYSKGKLLSKIRSKLNGDGITDIIFSFNPNLLLKFVKTDLDKNSRLLQKLVGVINNKENDNDSHYDLLLEFINNFQDDDVQLKKIGAKFSAVLKVYPDRFEDFEDVLKKSVVASALITLDLLEEFIKNLVVDPDTEDTKIKVKIINQYDSSKGLSPKLLKQYIEKNIEFLAGNDLLTNSFWFKQLSPLITTIKDESLKDNVFTTLNNKNTFLWQQYNPQWNQEEYQKCLENFLTAANEYYILSKASKSEIEAWFSNFFSRAESPELAIRINKLYKKTINHFSVFDWAFSDQIITKFNQLTEWEDKEEIAKTLSLMLLKTTNEKGLNESQIQTILNNYINNINSAEEAVKSWLSEAIKNIVVKTQLAEVINKLSTDDKLDLLDVIKELDKSLLKDSVEKIISETDADNLEENFQKLDNSKAGLTLINSGIEKTVKSLQEENNKDYFQKFLGVIVEREELPENVRAAIVSKVSSFLHNGKTNEEKVFALQVLDKITIPKSKKTLIRELLKDFSNDDFDDEEKVLFEKIKKKTKE